MAYSELIKNFKNIRSYMREFYIYGFKSREEYDAKSARSYDNERRQMERWLGDFMSFRQDSGGKQIFLPVDICNILHNPLYQASRPRASPGAICCCTSICWTCWPRGSAYRYGS